MKGVIGKYYEGRKDGYENKPKQKGLKGDNKKAYENGYGKEWQKLCTERTPDAIRAAFDTTPKGVMEKLLDKVHASTIDKVD